MAAMLEVGTQMMTGEREAFPVARLLGLVLKEIEPGRAVWQMRAEDRHHNPMGSLHGGVYCDLADAVMGWAYSATLAEGENFTTIEMKLNFLRTVKQATLTAEANPASERHPERMLLACVKRNDSQRNIQSGCCDRRKSVAGRFERVIKT